MKLKGGYEHGSHRLGAVGWIAATALAFSATCSRPDSRSGGDGAAAERSPSGPQSDAGWAGDTAGPGGARDSAAPRSGPWGGSWTDPRITGDPAGQFGGPNDPAGRPVVVYPLRGSMHPINLADVTFQWAQGKATSTLFRLRLENQRGQYDLFVPCTTPECVYPMPETVWLEVARQNAGEGVSLTVAGTDGRGGPVAKSDALALLFSPESVRGGLYYWSTALRGTYRLNFGQKKALEYIRPAGAGGLAGALGGGQCFGCHAVNRKGDVIAWTEFQTWNLRVAPTADPTRPTINGAGTTANLMTLNPDGTRILVSMNKELVLRDTATGTQLGKVDPIFLGLERAGFFPEWSPDGREIALTLSESTNQWDLDLPTGQIAVIPYNDGKFGPARIVAPKDKDYNFYPTWSPDGKWIAFASAPVGQGGGGSLVGRPGDSTYNTPNARLRLVSAQGGAIHELANATQGAGHTSTWPKFTPFDQAGGQVIFIAFNSKIDYGFLLKNSANRGMQRPQLWMFAIDLRRLGQGDISTAPIWLPFQDVTQQNHLPFWTELLTCGVGATAGPATCGDGEECRGGLCLPKM